MASIDTDLYLNSEQPAAISLLSARWSIFETEEMDFSIAALGQIVDGDQKLPHPLTGRIKRWRKLAGDFYKTPEGHRIIDGIIMRAKELDDLQPNVHSNRAFIISKNISLEQYHSSIAA